MDMQLVSGKCDNCGKFIKFDKKRPPVLYKFVSRPGKYVQVCYECFRKMCASVTYAFGE